MITAVWVSGTAKVKQGPSGVRETLHPAWGPVTGVFWPSFLIRFVLGNRQHGERCCFPVDLNIQIQLPILCVRCLFDTEHNLYTYYFLNFGSFLTFLFDTNVTGKLMVSHNTIVLSLTDPTVNLV